MDSVQLTGVGLQLILAGRAREIRPSVDIKNVQKLTLKRARELVRDNTPSTLIMAFEAGEDALSFLREEHQSYFVERTSEVYVAPRLLGDDTHSWLDPKRQRPRNPFAPRASRISRCLLLHHTRTFSIQELSRLAEVDKSLASRTLATLAAEGLVDVAQSTRDERSKSVRLTSPRRLLEEWRQARRRYHPVSRRIDIGTRSVDAMLRVVADVAELSTPYAISGLAGAAFVRRTVEPSEVLLLTTKDGIRRWSELLLADRAPTGQGRLRLTAVEDDFIFRVARPEGNLVIADPVQLWLDTSSSGERAREASEAIAEAMGW